MWVLVSEFLWGKGKRGNVWLVWRSRESQQTNASLVWGCSEGSKPETQQQHPVRQPQFWKRGCKHWNTAGSGNLWHYNYLLSCPAHWSLPCFPSRALLGRTGRLSSPFSLAFSLCSWDKCFGYSTRGMERRGSLIASGFCVHIQQSHPRESVGRGAHGVTSSTCLMCTSGKADYAG